MTHFFNALRSRLDGAGEWLAPLGLRLLVAYEFFSAGQQKLGAGSQAPDWFANQDFMFPFSVFSANMNWLMVTWTELIAGLAILFGLFTRFFAFALIAVTTIAIAAVHWPESWSSLGQLWEGYSVSRVMDDGEFRGNFRIPLLLLAMLIPLLFTGGGKISIDKLLLRFTGQSGNPGSSAVADANAFGLAALVFGLVFVYLIPSWGIVLLVVSAGLFVYARMAGGSHQADGQ